jgi:hypothetical protein
VLTKEAVLEALASKESGCLDGRDYDRLCDFLPSEDWPKLGFELPEERNEIKPWTEGVIIEQLRMDVAFGFEKALDKRGLSAGMMNQAVLMWLWILEDPLASAKIDYANYGLPLLKAVALKYGFPNRIGEDSGSESEYDDCC